MVVVVVEVVMMMLLMVVLVMMMVTVDGVLMVAISSLYQSAALQSEAVSMLSVLVHPYISMFHVSLVCFFIYVIMPPPP